MVFTARGLTKVYRMGEAEVHALRNPPLLIAVDHEGGRVQRFREGFTVLPAMAELGRSWDQDSRQALRLAQDLGFVLAAELRAHGVDLAMAPVLDVNSNPDNPIIGDRSFGSDPRAVMRSGVAFLRGLQEKNVLACGKHFPGHGDTSVDSHFDLPVIEHERSSEMNMFGATAVMSKPSAPQVVSSTHVFVAVSQIFPASQSGSTSS